MRTNKSFQKRLKLTKRGKLLSRPKHQNHFNAKESGERGLSKHGVMPAEFPKKVWMRFLKK